MSGQPKRYCNRGHDTWVVGRRETHNCIACERDRNRAMRKDPLPRSAGTGYRGKQPRLPFEPFERVMFLNGLTLWDVTSSNNARRWREQGIPLFTADELAVRWGWHPSEIWEEWYR